MSAAVELVDVRVRLGERTVLDGVSLAVEEGETLTLLGPSGSGKSTLVRVLLGLVVPQHGVVRLRGAAVTDGRRLITPPEERNLAVVFQDLALWPHLTVAGNLRFVLRSRRRPRNEEQARITKALEGVELSGAGHRYPGELSGGERQRVALARALVLDPDVVLFDEPLASLDVRLKGELLSLIGDLLAARRTTALWVSHDPREALALGRDIAVLEEGRIVQSGRRDELLASPATAFVAAVAAELAQR